MLDALDIFGELPDGLLEVETCELVRVCPRPTLIELQPSGESRRKAAVFVSITQHGNEDAGLLAMQQFFRQCSPEQLTRPLKIFVANVEASQHGVRFTDSQIDFNRSWPGTDLPPHGILSLLEQVFTRVAAEPLHASIDIHNNTGRNPHYGCICSLQEHHLNLASLFSERVVYFTRPKGVQTQAFMDTCPSVTLECGQVGELGGAHLAAQMLDKCMRTENFESTGGLQELDVMQTFARIQLREDCTVGFEPGADIVLREDIDLLNFRQLQPGEPIGRLEKHVERCLQVLDSEGNDVTERFVNDSQGQLRFERSVTPSMLTKDLKVIRQDCLGYLMDRVEGVNGLRRRR
ncbi:MAG: M14 family metallopeptidase [Planctomycetota bacterium]